MTGQLPKGDRLIVQEKLDGSNVGVCKVGGRVIAINRSGWTCADSPHEQHRMFDRWVQQRAERFDTVLEEGWRVCGEWLALAHGIKYKLPHEPFVAFDLFDENDKRFIYDDFWRLAGASFTSPRVMHYAESAYPIERARTQPSAHGAIEDKEGAVYRWERGDRVLMLAKWARPDMEPGKYLTGLKDRAVVNAFDTWNWREG